MTKIGIGIGVNSLRGGAFSPTNISGLAVWFDPADTDNMTLETINPGWNGNGQYVQKWTDKIGGAQVQEVTDAWQPFYDSVNAKLVCDINQRLQAINAPLTGLDNAITVAFLVKRNNPATDGSTVFELHDGSTNGRKQQFRADGDIRFMSNAGIDFQANNDFTDVTNWNTIFMIYNGASSELFRDNVSKATGTSANDSGLNQLELICSRTYGDKLDGSLGDFLIYNKALSSDERGKLQTWLDTRK